MLKIAHAAFGLFQRVKWPLASGHCISLNKIFNYSAPPPGSASDLPLVHQFMQWYGGMTTFTSSEASNNKIELIVTEYTVL